MRFHRQPDDILKELGIYSPDDIDLDLIAWSLGAEVKRLSLSDCEGNIIGTDKKAIITINNDSPLPRQRFSLGHELGHWINDRGKNLTYRCNSIDMKQRDAKKHDFKQSKEVRANQFSAQLIMPEFMCQQHLSGTDITLDLAIFIANEFRVSLTSALIRLVDLSKLPCMLICWDDNGTRKWFVRNKIVPEQIWPHKILSNPKTALTDSIQLEVDADKWINNIGSENYTVEENVYSNGYNVFSLLYWKDETQLLQFDE